MFVIIIKDLMPALHAFEGVVESCGFFFQIKLQHQPISASRHLSHQQWQIVLRTILDHIETILGLSWEGSGETWAHLKGSSSNTKITYLFGRIAGADIARLRIKPMFFYGFQIARFIEHRNIHVLLKF